MAGVVVDESHPKPHRLLLEMALLIAAVSSVDPSPVESQYMHRNFRRMVIPLAPKSFTFRKI